MKRWFLATLASAALVGSILHAQSGEPSGVDISKLEICVKEGRLPKNRYDPKTPQWSDFKDISIDKYARYYATQNLNGERVIVGN